MLSSIQTWDQAKHAAGQSASGPPVRAWQRINKSLKIGATATIALFIAFASQPASAQSFENLDLTPLQEPVQQDQQPSQPESTDSGAAASQAAPQVLPPKSFGDWNLRCEVAPGATEEACFMFQDVINPNNGQPMLQVAVGLWPPDKTRGLVVTTPLGVTLPPGIVIGVDGQNRAEFPYIQCVPSACQATYRMDDALLQAFKAGNAGSVNLHDSRRRPVTVPFSLRGFTAGFAEVK
ncbi:MAG: invasion associated locus B family protein [Pseudomonadota bacterium]